MRTTLLSLLLLASCHRTVTYEQATYAAKLSPGRYLIESNVNPVTVAMAWVHRKAGELCGDRYTLEGASATNRVATWTDGYGKTHSVNHDGYVATAICARAVRPFYCAKEQALVSSACFRTEVDCLKYREMARIDGDVTDPCTQASTAACYFLERPGSARTELCYRDREECERTRAIQSERFGTTSPPCTTLAN